MFSKLLQRLFFPDLNQVKNASKALWRERSLKLGVIKEGTIQRGAGRLSYLHIVAESGGQSECVIFCHPLSKKAKYFFTESKRAKYYLQLNCSVLAFDFNGFGDSDSIDLFYWRDVLAVIEYVNKMIAPSKIILHGVSFGAFHLLRAMQYLPSGSSVVVENVNKSLSSYWSRWWYTDLLVKFLQSAGVKSIVQMDVRDVAESFSRDDIKLQFIACELDQWTTESEMRELYGWFDSQCKAFTLFDGANHLTAPKNNPVLYQQVILDAKATLC